jgi:hypothetical protein
MEKYTEQHCRAVAQHHGGALIKLSPVSMAGIPDRLLLWPGGIIVFIEFKAPGKYLKPLQRHWFAKLQGMGFRVAVCRTMNDFRTLLDSLPKPP